MPDIFRFKQFNVDQSGCAMKINTDGVLLGAMAQANNAQLVLDIGTGTGVIALMLAQRLASAQIDAVEVDETAAQTAMLNFKNSPFANRLNAYALGFFDFFDKYPKKKYDLIISNPPFYINSLESPGLGKNLAKHADVNFFEGLISTIAAQLTKNGSGWLILPLQTAELVKALAEKHNLNLHKTIGIYSYPHSLPHREIFVLTLSKTKAAYEQFVIYKEPKVYSNQYIQMLKSFFTIFE